jgi:hypothetical protein
VLWCYAEYWRRVANEWRYGHGLKPPGMFCSMPMHVPRCRPGMHVMPLTVGNCPGAEHCPVNGSVLKLGGQAPAGAAVTTGAAAKAMAQPEATTNLAIGFRIAIVALSFGVEFIVNANATARFGSWLFARQPSFSLRQNCGRRGT